MWREGLIVTILKIDQIVYKIPEISSNCVKSQASQHSHTNVRWQAIAMITKGFLVTL